MPIEDGRNSYIQPQTLARVTETVTPDFLEKIDDYALAKLGQKWWRGVGTEKFLAGFKRETLRFLPSRCVDRRSRSGRSVLGF